MLAFARALVAAPSLMLADEPTEGLSPALVDALVEAMRRIHAQGMTILLVEQSLEIALALSDCVCVIDQGHVRFNGRTEVFAADEALQQELLGV